MEHPTVIVGAGIAGISAALALAGRCPLLLASTAAPDAASPAVTGGLANPLIPRRGNIVWQGEAALDALDALMNDLGVSPLYDRVLRVAASWEQMDAYRARAASHSDLFVWHGPGPSKEQWPWLRAPHGTLEIVRGRAVQMPELLEAGLDRLRQKSVSIREDWRLTDWSEDSDGIYAQFLSPEGGHSVRCSRLILAIGSGFENLPKLAQLRLHRVKGQLIGVRPKQLPENLCAVSSGGYMVPRRGHVILGSSYQHTFDDTGAEAAVSSTLLEKAVTSLPWLEGAEVRFARTGVRVTVPGTRLPMVGPVPGHSRTWILTGMASRGLLMAPLVASRLSGWLADPSTLPTEVQVRLTKSR